VHVAEIHFYALPVQKEQMINRRQYLKTAISTTVGAGLLGSSVQASPESQDWPQVRNGPHNSAYNANTGIKRGITRMLPGFDGIDLTQIWEFTMSSNTFHRPLVVGDTAYAAGETQIHAIDIENGQEAWSFDLGTEIAGSPAIANERLFVGTHNEKLLAINTQTHEKEWEFQIRNPADQSALDYNIRPPIIASGGIVYIGAGQLLLAIDADTGDELWRFNIEGSPKTAPAVAENPRQADPMVLICSSLLDEETDRLYAVRKKDGSKLWEFDVTFANYSPPAILNNSVYLAHETETGGKLSSISINDGEEVWNFETENRISETPVVADGQVFFSSQSVASESDDQTIYSLSPSGERLWTREIKNFGYSPGIVAIDGEVLTYSGQHLYALNASSGDTSWSKKLSTSGDIQFFTWVSVSQGLVFGRGEEGSVYAFRPDNSIPTEFAIGSGMLGIGGLIAGWRYRTRDNSTPHGEEA